MTSEKEPPGILKSYRRLRQRMITLGKEHEKALMWAGVIAYFIFSLWVMWALCWLIAF
jgi:hypothetical protein